MDEHAIQGSSNTPSWLLATETGISYGSVGQFGTSAALPYLAFDLPDINALSSYLSIYKCIIFIPWGFLRGDSVRHLTLVCQRLQGMPCPPRLVLA